MKLALAILTALVFSAPIARGDTDHNPGDISKRSVVFFEIPVTNMDRAVAFYEAIFSVKLNVMKKPEFTMAFFPADDGALVQYEGAVPGASGPIVYLNGGDDLSAIQARIEGAGGKVLIPKTLISPEVGYFAQFLDTEGNRLALFSAK